MTAWLAEYFALYLLPRLMAFAGCVRLTAIYFQAGERLAIPFAFVSVVITGLVAFRAIVEMLREVEEYQECN
jgi:hypothetical protein